MSEDRMIQKPTTALPGQQAGAAVEAVGDSQPDEERRGQRAQDAAPGFPSAPRRQRE